MKNTTKKFVFMAVWVFAASVALGSISNSYANNLKNGAQKNAAIPNWSYQNSMCRGRWIGSWNVSSEERRAQRDQRQQEREAYRQKVDAAFQKHDFEAWKSLVTADPRPWNSDLLEKIDTKEKFEKLVEMHNLRSTSENDSEKIRTELGLESRGGMKQGGFGKGKGIHRSLR